MLLYRKRPQASLNCILVDDNGTVIYRGVATSAPPMQNHTEVRMDRVEKVKVFKSSVLKYLTFQELEGTMGSLLASYDHLMVNLRFVTIFDLITDISLFQLA